MTARALPPDNLVGTVADLIWVNVILRSQPFLNQFGKVLGEAIGKRRAKTLTKGAADSRGVVPSGSGDKLDRGLENMVATLGAFEPGPDGRPMREVIWAEPAVLFIEPHGGAFRASFRESLGANNRRFDHVLYVALSLHWAASKYANLSVLVFRNCKS